MRHQSVHSVLAGRAKYVASKNSSENVLFETRLCAESNKSAPLHQLCDLLPPSAENVPLPRQTVCLCRHKKMCLRKDQLSSTVQLQLEEEQEEKLRFNAECSHTNFLINQSYLWYQ